MLVFRLVFGLLLVATVLCFGMYVGTRQAVWWRRCVTLLKWALVAGCAMFAVLILERLAVLL